MKLNFFFIVLSVSLNFHVFGNSYIAGEVLNFKDDFILIQRPINGYYNNTSFDKKDTIDIINNKFSVDILCNKSVFVTLSLSGLPIRVIIKPGDSLYIKIDFFQKNNKNKVECFIRGANEAGQLLFYEYNYWPAEKFQNIWKILKKSPTVIVSEVNQEITTQIEPFGKLYAEKKITKDFYELVSVNIKSLLLFESIRKIIDPNIKDLKFAGSLRMRLTDSLFLLLDPKNKYINYGVNSNFYSKLYLNYEQGIHLKTNNFFKLPDTTVSYKRIKFHISGDFSYYLYGPNDQNKEVLFGSQLLNYLTISGGTEILKNEIDYFKILYPSSQYLQPIIFFQNKQNIEENKGTEELKSFRQTPIEIIDSTGGLKDFANILKEVRSSVVYVDVWATWCGPCISEMKYNFKIDSFLYVNKIKRLYISIDDINNVSKWNHFIYKLGLGGMHVIANDNIKGFLTEKFGLGNTLIAIPIYFIVINGEIEAAYRPSEFDKLKEQFAKILQKRHS